MKNIQIQYEERLLKFLCEHLPHDKYPEGARLALSYGGRCKELAEQETRYRILERIDQFVNDEDF